MKYLLILIIIFQTLILGCSKKTSESQKEKPKRPSYCAEEPITPIGHDTSFTIISTYKNTAQEIILVFDDFLVSTNIDYLIELEKKALICLSYMIDKPNEARLDTLYALKSQINNKNKPSYDGYIFKDHVAHLLQIGRCSIHYKKDEKPIDKYVLKTWAVIRGPLNAEGGREFRTIDNAVILKIVDWGS